MRHARNRNTGAALVAMLLVLTAVPARSQTSVEQAMLRAILPAAPAVESADISPSTSVAAALQQVVALAAVAFTGSVAEVQPDPSGGARVTFQVERGVRGVASGAGYIARISAWAGGANRFYPGQRALFLLTAPSISGFSAPVMGERGIVPLSGDSLVGNLDLRWIAADVQRGTAFTESSVAATARLRAASVSGAPSAEATSSSAGNLLTLPDVHAIDRDLVLDLLRTAPSAPERTRS